MASPFTLNSWQSSKKLLERRKNIISNSRHLTRQMDPFTNICVTLWYLKSFVALGQNDVKNLFTTQVIVPKVEKYDTCDCGNIWNEDDDVSYCGSH